MFNSPYSPYMGQNQLYPQYNMQNQLQSNLGVSQSLTRVNGIDGAKAYQMPPNSTAALFDANDDIMYIKVTDGAGFGNIRKFRFVEMQDNQTPPTADYVSRDEFNQFKQEVLNYGKQSVPTKPIKPDKSADA